MARIRSIKPQFFKNEDLAELPMVTRLLYIGLWTLADRDGKLEDRPKRIKADVFPYDTVDVEKDLSRLQSAGFIMRYGVGDLKVIAIPTFNKHQRITGSEAASVSELPDYDENATGNTLETPTTQLGNNLDSLNKGKGKGYRKGKGDAFAPPSKKDVEDYFCEKGYKIETGAKAWNYYSEAGWKDARGNQVKNWKQKMISVWFKPENEAPKSPLPSETCPLGNRIDRQAYPDWPPGIPFTTGNQWRYNHKSEFRLDNS